MRDSAFVGFENTSQPEAIVALVKSSRYDCRHDLTSLVATMIEAGKTAIYESSSPST